MSTWARARTTPGLCRCKGVTLLAKLLKSAFEILLELSGVIGITTIIDHYLGLSRLDISIPLSAATVVIGIVIYKIDWETTFAWATRAFPTQGPTCHGQVIECAFDCSQGHNKKGLLYGGSAEPSSTTRKSQRRR